MWWITAASDRVPEIAQSLGIDLRYLPGYSPDLNGIELAFSKIKVWLGKAAAVTFEALSVAVRGPKSPTLALDAVSLADVRAFFPEVGCWRPYF
ncbi:MAG: transposase [Truepera sp.]|nr:transposase [Truepera sp.]